MTRDRGRRKRPSWSDQQNAGLAGDILHRARRAPAFLSRDATRLAPAARRSCSAARCSPSCRACPARSISSRSATRSSRCRRICCSAARARRWRAMPRSCCARRWRCARPGRGSAAARCSWAPSARWRSAMRSGFGALTGAAVRYRVYGAEGGTARHRSRASRCSPISASPSRIFGFGGAGAMIAAPTLAALLGMRASLLMAGGGALVALALAPLLWCGADRARLAASGASPWNGRRGAARSLQMALNAADLLIAGAALYVLQPAAGHRLPELLRDLFLRHPARRDQPQPGRASACSTPRCCSRSAGACRRKRRSRGCIAYRAIYFLLPLVLAAALLAVSEMRGLAAGARGPQGGGPPAGARSSSASSTFAIGAMLVFSGATPAFGHRLALLEPVMPLWMLEGSTFLGSLVGVLLLFIARGLLPPARRRLVDGVRASRSRASASRSRRASPSSRRRCSAPSSSCCCWPGGSSTGRPRCCARISLSAGSWASASCWRSPPGCCSSPSAPCPTTMTSGGNSPSTPGRRAPCAPCSA